MKESFEDLAPPTHLTKYQIEALIKFSEEHLGNESCKAFSISFPKISEMTGFIIDRFSLGNNVQALITALPISTKILILSGCSLTFKNFQTTLESVSDRFTNVKFLSINDCLDADDNTGDQQLLEFPSMPNTLEHLDIGCNNFGKHFFSLAETLPQSLQKLSLSINSIGDSAAEIFEIIANRLPNLKFLSVDSLGEKVDTLSVLKCIGKFSRLTALSFTENNLDIDCLEFFKTLPAKMPLLKEVDIGHYNPSIVNTVDIEELENWFKDHNKESKSMNNGLFVSLMACKDTNSDFCLNEDIISHLIRNHYEPVVELITQNGTLCGSFD